MLATDAILLLQRSIAQGLKVNRAVIRRAVERELPFLATETLLMEGVKAGSDRQDLHERVRAHSFEVKRRMHEQGADNDLLERLGSDPRVPFTAEELRTLCDPQAFTGRSAEQVDRFLASELEPYLAACGQDPSADPEPEIRV
jgi:adenylosuccinate lyase